MKRIIQWDRRNERNETSEDVPPSTNRVDCVTRKPINAALKAKKIKKRLLAFDNFKSGRSNENVLRREILRIARLERTKF
jgi:hypothetical protein